MNVILHYGKTGLPVEFDDRWDVTVIEKKRMPIAHNPQNTLQEALACPCGSNPLAVEAQGCKSACIVICDITRPVPNGLFLPLLIRTLLDAGIPAGSITIVVATGLHRPNEGKELEELVGDKWVLETVKVVNHFARDDEAHVDLGATPNGTPVKIDRRFVEADLKIVTGLVEPHFMAGYSGGRKVIAPGIAHKDTITTFHSSRFMAHPCAANCVLEGNPLHLEQLEIVKKVGKVLALNTVIDEQRRLSFVNFGGVLESHLQAVEFIREYAVVRVPKKFRTVITSAAGYPLDKTYYQTVKGMVGPLDILAPGGNLIIAAECSEGMGSAEYVEAQRRLLARGNKAFLAELAAKRFADIDEWQTQQQLKPMQISTVQLYSSGLSAQQKELTGVKIIDSVEGAAARSVQQFSDPAVAVIPEGPYVIPVCDTLLS